MDKEHLLEENMTTIEEYDCQKCGACCAFFCHVPKHGRPTVSTELKERDLQRLPPHVKDKMVQVDLGCRTHTERTTLLLPAVKTKEGAVCGFFEGSIGSNCGCSIYEYRPYNCRHFAADFDNPSCRMARSWAGIEPVERWIEPCRVQRLTDSARAKLEPYIKKEEEVDGGLMESGGDFTKARRLIDDTRGAGEFDTMLGVCGE